MGSTATLNEWAHRLLDKVGAEGFYGEVTFKFTAGRAQHAAKTETVVPPEVAERHERNSLQKKGIDKPVGCTAS